MTIIDGSYGRNPKLYDAISEGDLEATQQEIEKDPFAFEGHVNVSRETLLHIAISKQKWEIAKKILKFMEDNQDEDQLQDLLVKKNLNGNTLLHELASKVKSTTSEQESTEVAKAILSIHNRSTDENNRLVQMRNTHLEIPLHKAALFGHTKMFKYLVSEESDVRARSEGGATVLHCAVMSRRLELAETILRGWPGAPGWPEVRGWPELRLYQDHQGMTPLHLLVTNPKTFKSGTELGIIDSFIYKSIPPKGDISLYEGNENDIQADHTGGDEDGKAKDCVSLAIENEDNLKTLAKKFPPNYVTCFDIGHWMHSLCSVIAGWRHSSPLMLIVSKARDRYDKIVKLKRTHEQALRLIRPLCGKNVEYWTQLNNGTHPGESTSDTDEIVNLVIKPDGKNGGGLNLNGDVRGKDLPHILAAKMGATSFVDRIMQVYPPSVKLTGDDKKNILQVAVEHRQADIIKLIEDTGDWLSYTVFGKDKESDTILHSAARIGDTSEKLVHFQMLQEIQWFDRVKKRIPRELVYHRNLKGETAKDLFTSCHADMVKNNKDQLTSTAQSCSALVAAVVFATSISIPGGTHGESGQALLLDKPAFKVFTHAYAVGLSSAATALLLFLSLSLSPYTENEFRRSLPIKVSLAFVFLFVTLACMMVAFSSNIYLTLNGKRNAVEIVPVLCELTVFPAFAFAVLFLRRESIHFFRRAIFIKP